MSSRNASSSLLLKGVSMHVHMRLPLMYKVVQDCVRTVTNSQHSKPVHLLHVLCACDGTSEAQKRIQVPCLTTDFHVFFLGALLDADDNKLLLRRNWHLLCAPTCFRFRNLTMCSLCCGA
jgi:hypothetical protein